MKILRERPAHQLDRLARDIAETGSQARMLVSPPSDDDCHTPLPCEVRKGNDSTHERAVLTARHPARMGRTPGTGATERRLARRLATPKIDPR